MSQVSKESPLLLDVKRVEENINKENHLISRGNREILQKLNRKENKTPPIQREPEDILDIIIHENFETLNPLHNYQLLFKITGLISFFIFLILLLVKLILIDKESKEYTSEKFTYYYLLLPALLTIVSATLWANFLLKTRIVMENAVKQYRNEQIEGFDLGHFICYLGINSAGIGMAVYFVLLSVKLQNKIDPMNSSVFNSFNIIAIPIYIISGILLFNFIFLVPGLIKSKLYLLVFNISNYSINGFISFLLLNLKLDKMIDVAFFVVFIPLILAIFISLAQAAFLIFYSNHIFLSILYFLGILSLLIGVDLIALKSDKKINQSYLPVIFLLISFLFQINYVDLFTDNTEDQDKKPMTAP